MAYKPRVLALMGSGETSPTMVTVHRELVRRLGVRTPKAVLLDAPYGFQENVDDVTAKAQAYFRDSVGLSVSVISGPDPGSDQGHDEELTAIRTADWTFAGPGSPTYLLRCWQNGPFERALRDRVRTGSGVTLMASAAAATVGRFALPVYEIYKAGIAPHWLPGLDLLGELGLSVALIPHYNSTEGGQVFDTRYCYLGERRLAVLEKELPEDSAVLGLDEHTAAYFDLDTRQVEIVGKGGLTARRLGLSTFLPAGTSLSVDELRAQLACAGEAAFVPRERTEPEPAAAETQSLAEIITRCELAFESALEQRDAPVLARAILDLESAIGEWAADTEEDEGGTAQAGEVMRSLIVRLGALADKGIRDPRTVLAPAVEPLIELRRQLRDRHEYESADAVRDALSAAGVELRDSPDGTEWLLHQS